MEFINGFLTVVLVLLSVVMILLVLTQRGSANGGLGAAMGGGMAESALGAETSSVLSKWTRNVAIVFFVLIFGLYLSKLHLHESDKAEGDSLLPEFAAEELSDAPVQVDSLPVEAEELASEAEAEASDVSSEAQQ